MTIFLWGFALSPMLFIFCLLLFQSEDDLPPVSMLDNPPELLASVVYADDGQTELGRFWKVNRTSVEYKSISPYLTDALIATEDERFHDHSGVDLKALGRAVTKLGSDGGGSTITQQLAKQLFTLQKRELDAIALANGESIDGSSGRIGALFSRIGEKARENIIAIRLEARYTKEEIITMYLNQFDFLYNAVGIENAAKVYYNKTPKNLSKEEAAMLVGMCKNPSLYNPHTFTVRNYRGLIAVKKGIDPDQVTSQEIRDARATDSLRTAERRNQVLYQWMKNSKSGNTAIRFKLSEKEYNKLKSKPVVHNYQLVEHKPGMAPYFREQLRSEVNKLLTEKKADGTFKYRREDGALWDVYRDGLKIYTTLNVDMQKYAEEALEEHLKENLQPRFDRNNRGLRNYPFSNSITDEEVEQIMTSSMHRTDRYKSLVALGYKESEIRKNFNQPTNMTVFGWDGEMDTLMTPFDSIRYYKSFLQAGLISIEPETGFIKAWVGGADINHFAYDHVRQGRRQVGSTIKPFIYAAGIATKVAKPGLVIPDTRYCVDLYDPQGKHDGQWCPQNVDGSGTGGRISVKRGLAFSRNNVSVYIMREMGAKVGPQTVAKLMRSMDMDVRDVDIVPSMCLGSMDLSLFEMVGAQATFANRGIFNPPTAILRIEDRNGHVIYSAKSASREVMDEQVAYTVLKMMRGVVDYGTAGRLRYATGYGGITFPTAGKTGTTQNNSDGWFIGLTPDLATGVWVGAEDRAVRFKSTDEGQGSRTALPIYGYFMNKVYKDANIAVSTTDFIKPDDFDDGVFNLTGSEYIPETEQADSIPEVNIEEL